MKIKFNQKLWTVTLVISGMFALVWLTTNIGCGKTEKPECTSNLDCGDEQTCLNDKCVNKGDEGSACSAENPCRRKSSTGKDLVCANNVCKVRCETRLDCDRNDEICDINSGICIKAPVDAGDEQIPEQGPKQQIGDTCGPGLLCDNGLDCIKLDPTHTNGKCWKTCTSDNDCQAGRLCSAGYCVPSGENCHEPKFLCWSGLKCALDSPAEGQCYRTCQDQSQCPSGLTCSKKGNEQYCMAPQKQAGANEPCGKIGGEDIGCIEGFDCIPERPNSPKQICTKRCKTDDDCTWPRFCQGGICVLGSVGTVQLGQVCSVTPDATEDKKCDGGLYCLVLKQDAKEGICYRDCAGSRAPPCPNGLTCMSAAQQSLCFKQCKDAADCSAPTSTCAKIQGVPSDICLHPTN